MDHISHSCSLLNILSYIDHKDIPKAQLVSRRFNQLINENASQLPRPRAYLYISTASFEDLPYLREFITVEYALSFGKDLRRTSICITDETMRLYKGARKDFTDYLDNNGVLITDQSEEEEAFFQNFKGTDNLARPWFGGIGKEKDYLSGGIENGLSLVMTLILRQYHFECVVFNNGYHVEGSREANWYSSIAQMARRALTYSTGFHLWRAWSGMVQLFKAFVSRNVLVRNESRESFADFLPKLDIFNGDLKLWVERPGYVDSFQPVVEYIKKWEAGRSRFPYLEISSRSCVPIKYSQSDFLATMESNFQVVVSNREDAARGTSQHAEAVIARASDDVVLCLAYFNKFKQIFMGDTQWTGQAPDVKHILELL